MSAPRLPLTYWLSLACGIGTCILLVLYVWLKARGR